MKQESKLENSEPSYPQYINSYDQQDEISLVDLWIAFSKFKKSFLLFFILSIVVGALVVTVTEPKPKPIPLPVTAEYVLSTIIDVAVVSNTNGSSLIETPSAVISRINALILPKSTQKVMMDNNLPFFETTIENPKDTNLVIIKNDVKKQDMSIYSAFQLEVGDKVVDAHAALVQNLNRGVNNDIASVEALVSQELDFLAQHSNDGSDQKIDFFYKFMGNIQQSRRSILALKGKLETGSTQVSRAELSLQPNEVVAEAVAQRSNSKVYIIVVLLSFFLSIMFILMLMFRAKVIERLAEEG